MQDERKIFQNFQELVDDIEESNLPQYDPPPQKKSQVHLFFPPEKDRCT